MKEKVKVILDKILFIESIIFAVYTGLMILSVTCGTIDLKTSFILLILWVIGYHIVVNYFDYVEVRKKQKEIVNTIK